MNIIDAHSHLWLRQDTSWDGKAIRTLTNGRSLFLGEEVQMIPPFIIDGRNTAEVFLSNMDYAQVSAAVVVQEFIDGIQNDYLAEVQRQWPDRFFVFGMADYLHDGFLGQARQLLLAQGFRGLAIPAHRLLGQSLNSDEMMEMFRMMEANDKWLSITLADGDRQVAELGEVIAECPRLKIAIGHLGVLPLPQRHPCHPRGCRPCGYGETDVGQRLSSYHHRHHLPHVIRLRFKDKRTHRRAKESFPWRQCPSFLSIQTSCRFTLY